MSTYTDEEIKLLADSIALTHAVFSDIHDPLAREHGDKPFMILRVLCPGAAIHAALMQAREHEYLVRLLDKLNDAHAFDETASQGHGNQVIAQLQAVLNRDIGFGIPNVMLGGGQTAYRRVCRVLIDGTAIGTGFLVGPQAILTAYHVVDALIDPRTGALPGSFKKLGFEFERAGRGYATERVQAAEGWLLAHSQPHALETTAAPFDLESASDQDFDTCLDFALVRPEHAVGRERGWYQLDENKRPCVSGSGSREITLFQHPGGASMRLAHGQTIRLWPPRHGTRLHHSANSERASSGGLLLNSSYEMIGLHNATLKCVAKASNDDNAQLESEINVAVPTATIAKGANVRDKASSIEGLDPIVRIPGTGAPVVGRDHFQRLVLRAVAGHKRVLIVRGPKGTGKSFSAEILKAMLKTDGHKYAVLQAADLSAIPERLAATVLQPLTIDDASTMLPSSADAQTAADAWIRDVLYPAMMEQLRIAANGAMVWLVVDNLDINPLAQSSSMHLLDRIFLDIERYDFLRVVLIAPSAIPNIPPRAVDYDECAHVTEPDVTNYVKRRLVEVGKGTEEPETYVRAILHMANDNGVTTVENVARNLREWFEKEMHSS